METNYYEILGVSDNASRDEIREAYLYLSEKYHPSNNPDANASAMYRMIEQAYHQLTAPVNYSPNSSIAGETYSEPAGDCTATKPADRKAKNAERAEKFKEKTDGILSNITIPSPGTVIGKVLLFLLKAVLLPVYFILTILQGVLIIVGSVINYLIYILITLLVVFGLLGLVMGVGGFGSFVIAVVVLAVMVCFIVYIPVVVGFFKDLLGMIIFGDR